MAGILNNAANFSLDTNLSTPLATLDITGNAATATLAATATNANNVLTTSTSTNASFFPLFSPASTTGNQAVNVNSGLAYNPSTNTLTATTFNGNATTATLAATATNANNVLTTNVNTNATFYPLFAPTSTTGDQAVNVNSGLTYNPSTNTLTVGIIGGSTAWQGGTISPAYGGTGVANDVNSTITLGGAVNTNGAFTIGNTSAGPNALTFTLQGQDTSLTLPPGPGTVALVGGGYLSWVSVSANTTMMANTGYVVAPTNSTDITVTLPATAVLGAEVRVLLDNASGTGGVKIVTSNPAAKIINYGIRQTATSNGALISNDSYACIIFTCVDGVGNLWNGYGSQGNFTVVNS